ncbi:hypothetical protein J0H58_31705 [bacterium]|nr:hypothetical protein [bacterium]
MLTLHRLAVAVLLVSAAGLCLTVDEWRMDDPDVGWVWVGGQRLGAGISLAAAAVSLCVVRRSLRR